ncbi:MAG TPA: Ig domain-containing protein [Actinophytocola sp.]|uniref:Ig domain-containing protein n=1 Tax=Actinophytocola sp. TaxID=1872138 RepID=UPI002DF8982E|nr:Ig domain-containing protein [Actinophytocola sp.]
MIPFLSLLVTALMLAGAVPPASAEPSSGSGLSAALIVNNPGPQTSQQDHPDSLQMTATGGVPPYTWSAVALPPGLTINSATGLISGDVFGAPGTLPTTVTARDTAGASNTVGFTWRILNNCPRC